MRLIDWKTLSKMQPYCRVHIGRLERDGKFPKRVRLGPHRVAWVEAEVVAKLEEWASQR